MMPELSGFQVLARLKADERLHPHPGDHDLGRCRRLDS